MICQRKPGASFGGYWEFPGGKVEGDESFQDCLLREVREEVDIVIGIDEQLSEIEHDYVSANVRLHPFLCHHLSGEPRLVAVQDVRWITPSELNSFKFPEGNESLNAEVIRRLT